MEQQEDINKLVECANKWQINFNVDKCSVMHIGHISTAGSGNHHHQRPQVAKTNREKLQNCQPSTGVHCPQFQVEKQRTDPPIIQIPSSPTSRTCSAILGPLFKTKH